MQTLSEICTLITDGSHFSPEDEGSGYPMLSVKDMRETDFDFSDCKHVGEESFRRLVSNGCRPMVGDVVVAKDGSYLKSAFPITEDRDIAVLSSIAILRPIPSLVVPAYLSYYLKSTSVYHTVNLNYITGTALKRIILAGIRKLPIDLPDLSEQSMRVKLLDAIYRIIQIRKKQLCALNTLIKSQFVEMFGDPVTNPKGHPVKKLTDIGENLDSRRIPITSGDRKEGPYPYYGASGIVDYVDDYIFDEDILLISEDGANLLARVTPIAFSSSGKVWVNNHAHVMRFNDMAVQTYIEHLLNMIDISNYVTGTAQPKLNQAKLNSIPIPVPDVLSLHKYKELVDQIAKSKFIVKQALAKAQLLFNSLMQQYFG